MTRSSNTVTLSATCVCVCLTHDIGYNIRCAMTCEGEQPGLSDAMRRRDYAELRTWTKCYTNSMREEGLTYIFGRILMAMRYLIQIREYYRNSVHIIDPNGKEKGASDKQCKREYSVTI